MNNYSDSEATDTLRHEANARAHEVARAALEKEKARRAAYDPRISGYLRLAKAQMAYVRALSAYEEVDRRAQKEATA